MTLHRRLYRSQNGWIGLGNTLIREGDEVWILRDARLPFILRKVDNGRRRLVGTCYMHGIMHGEAISAEEEWERIELE